MAKKSPLIKKYGKNLTKNVSKKVKKFSKDKKRLFIAVVSVIVLIAVAEVGYLVQSGGIAEVIQTFGLTEKAQADRLKDMGVEAFHKGNINQAKDLLSQAKQKYQSLGDTNGTVDADALIWLVDHS